MPTINPSDLPLAFIICGLGCLLAACVLVVSTLIMRHSPSLQRHHELWYILVSLAILFAYLFVLATDFEAGLMLTLGGGVGGLIGLIAPWGKRVIAEHEASMHETP